VPGGDAEAGLPPDFTNAPRALATDQQELPPIATAGVAPAPIRQSRRNAQAFASLSRGCN
jgi:hypothetical protein